MRESDYARLYSASFPFWAQLSVAERARLCGVSRSIRAVRGTLLSDGTRDGVVLLRSGSARTFLLSEDGREISLFRLGAGEPLFLSVPAAPVPGGIFIAAESECECCFLPHAAFAEIAAHYPPMENFALRCALSRTTETAVLLCEILLTGVAQRLAVFLLDEAKRRGSAVIPLTQEEIARAAGSAREVVSRTLKVFSARGLVETGRGKVRITDPAGLRQISQGGR